MHTSASAEEYLTRLRMVADDWERYGRLPHPWGKEMQRALIVEMKVAVQALERLCTPEDGS